MRYLILSDMHANWEAFETVLEAARPDDFDVVLVLGDLVGYGAAPDQVVEAVRALSGTTFWVRGNHDKVVAGIDPGDQFNEAALAAARWTAGELAEENLRFVEELPEGPTEVGDGVAICHGSPLDEDAYVFSDLDAFEIFHRHQQPLTFFGHTHVPSVFALTAEGIVVRAVHGDAELTLESGVRYLLNPGSIGQPRDRDPRAAYMTYDSERRTASWFRCDYPIERAQARIRSAGLPSVLAERLALGI
jgi:predicted phosphodiesterase